MSQFILILFWFAIMAVFARFVDVSKTVTIKGKQKQVVYWWFAVLVFVPIIYMAVFRDARWEDTGAYIGAYRNFPETMSGFASAINAVKKDKAFYAVGMLTKILISKDYRVFFFLLATFQAYCVIKLLQEHSPHFLLSVFVFWASTDCVSWMFNGIRQFTAVCICLLATNWVLKKKYIPAVLTILIASFFHQTALLMIPVFLVASGKMANYKTVIVIILVIFAVAYVDRFTNLLDAMLEDTQYH